MTNDETRKNLPCPRIVVLWRGKIHCLLSAAVLLLKGFSVAGRNKLSGAHWDLEIRCWVRLGVQDRELILAMPSAKHLKGETAAVFVPYEGTKIRLHQILEQLWLAQQGRKHGLVLLQTV
jgi:hypothetical protein